MRIYAMGLPRKEEVKGYLDLKGKKRTERDKAIDGKGKRFEIRYPYIRKRETWRGRSFSRT